MAKLIKKSENKVKKEGKKLYALTNPSFYAQKDK